MNLINVNSLETQFYCFISFHLWLCISCQYSLCLTTNFTIEFVRVEPKEIVSINENIVVYFKSSNEQIIELTVTFYNLFGSSILCLNSFWTAIDSNSSMVNCTTGTFDVFNFSSSLDLETKIFCKNKFIDVHLVENVTTVIDPKIKDYTKYVFTGQPSTVEIVYDKIHEKHINQTSLSYENTICDRVNFEDQSDQFNCTINQRVQGLANETIDFMVSLSGRHWHNLKIYLLPMPTIERTFGSTFAGAFNPIFIIGSGFSPEFASEIFLMTNYSTIANKCSYLNETLLSCIVAHGLEPVNLVTQVNFTLLLGPTFTIPSKVSFTQNSNPFIISVQFSFSDQLLTLILYNYDSYYKQFTKIEIFDATRKDTTPCKKLRLTSISTLTCEPTVKLSPDYPYNHYATLKINSWKIIYKCINCSTNASSFSKTYIVVGILSALLLSIITSIFICNQLEPSNTLSVFKLPSKNTNKATRHVNL